jgi:hypothetical protein
VESSVTSPEDACDGSGRDCTRSTIDALRSSGDHRANPVRFRLIEAMARRSATRDGALRRLLDDRLNELLSDYCESLERVRRATEVPVNPSGPGALAALVAEVASRARTPAPDAGGSGAAAEPSSPPLEMAQEYFRSTWARLSAQQRLNQSLERVPGNAGPLNSNYLVHQSLKLMQAVSPEYLHRFTSYVDALLELDRLGGDGDGCAKPVLPRSVRGGPARGRA